MIKLLVVLVASLFCCMSCGSDDAVDPGRPAGSPPQIADLDCFPASATENENGGAITLACTVNFEDADMDLETLVVRFRRDCGGGSWQEIPKDLEAGIKSNADVTRYDYHVTSQNVAATSRNYKATPSAFKSKALFGFEVDMVTTMEDTSLGLEWFIYPCHGGILCQTFVMLGSPQTTFENSRPAFEAVIESLTMHDVKPTVPNND